MNRPREIEHLLSSGARDAGSSDVAAPSRVGEAAVRDATAPEVDGRALAPVDTGAMLPAATRPQPLYLVAAGHTCAAWWHAPAAERARPLAVVLAGSWGDEDLASHDDVRALAVRLADAGFGVVRLEWPDMGDSSATSGTTGVADALAALEAAAQAARSLSGRGRLAVAGVRIGALLAAHAAVARRDVEALVAIAPVGSGGAFLRDLAAAGEDTAASRAGSAMRLGGFSVPEERAMEIASLQWPTAGAGGVAQALVIGAPSSPPASCMEALARLGVRVAIPADAQPGVRRMDSPLFADAIGHPGIVGWLDELAPALVSRAATSAAPADVAAHGGNAWLRTSALGVRVRERICEVAMPRANGELSPPLAAVLTERDLAEEDGLPFGTERAPRGLVLVSTAGGRRVGPHRLWTGFARERAARGEVVLRIDLAGTGDSAPRSPHDAGAPPQPYDSRCVDDIARALAWLRRERGVGACTVLGLGTGAHHAWRAAVLGIDVQHVVAVNTSVFHWPPESGSEAALGAADDARGWRALPGVAALRRRVKAVEARADRLSRSAGREAARALGWRLVDDLAGELALCAHRGVALDFVFSRGERGLATLREEAGRTGRALVRGGALRILELAPREPTFASPEARAELVARLHVLLADAGAGGAFDATADGGVPGPLSPGQAG